MIKKIISIIMILLLISIPTTYAAGETNFSVILSTDKQEAEKGSEVVITVDLGEFSNVGAGVNSFMADLEYDKTKISIKEVQSGTEMKKEITALNDWDNPDYHNDRVVTTKGSFVTAKESVMKIVFVVNESAAVGTTAITVKNPEAANEDNDFEGKIGTINITIKEKNPAQQECEHTYGDCTDNEDGTHSTECTKCHDKQTENCQYEVDGDKKVCQKCGAEIALCNDDSHTYEDYTNNEDGTHSRECTKCHDKQTENCEYEVDGDKKVCSKCGAEVAVTEEHTHTHKEFKDNGDGTHTSKCEGCDEELKEKHTYKDGKCTECGATEPKGDGKEYPNAGITTTLLVAITIIAVMAIVLYRKNQTYKGI